MARARQSRHTPEVWEVFYSWYGEKRTIGCGRNEELAKRRETFINEEYRRCRAEGLHKPENVADIHLYLKTLGTEGLKQTRLQPTTIDQLIDLYLEHLAERASRADDDVDKCSENYAQEQRWGVERFLDHCQHYNERALDEAFADDFLDEYKNEIRDLKKPDGTQYANWSKNKLAMSVKRLILWAAKKRYIDRLPLDIAEYHRIKTIRQPEPEPYTIDELKQIIDSPHTNTRLRLLILLALNTAWTSVDAATFKQTHINWSTGVITRPRHKTKQPFSCVLWAETLRLLKRHHKQLVKTHGKKKVGDLILVGRNGLPLVHWSTSKNGKRFRNDAIYAAFKRAIDLAGVRGSFKILRKTGPEMIKQKYGEEKQYLVNKMLAHSTKGIQAFGYVTNGDTTLLEAVDWLGRYLHENGIKTR